MGAVEAEMHMIGDEVGGGESLVSKMNRDGNA